MADPQPQSRREPFGLSLNPVAWLVPGSPSLRPLVAAERRDSIYLSKLWLKRRASNRYYTRDRPNAAVTLGRVGVVRQPARSVGSRGPLRCSPAQAGLGPLFHCLSRCLGRDRRNAPTAPLWSTELRHSETAG